MNTTTVMYGGSDVWHYSLLAERPLLAWMHVSLMTPFSSTSLQLGYFPLT